MERNTKLVNEKIYGIKFGHEDKKIYKPKYDELLRGIANDMNKPFWELREEILEITDSSQ